MSDTPSIKAAPPQTMDEFNQRFGAKPVTWKALNAVLDTTHGEFIKAVKALKTELAEALREIEQLKARPMPKYCGIHQDGAAYSAGDLVTKAGGLWFCADATTTTPGTGGGWRLIVKSGRA